MKELKALLFPLLFMWSFSYGQAPTKVWQSQLSFGVGPGYSENKSEARSIIIDNDGHFVISGLTVSNSEGFRAGVARISPEGTMLWKSVDDIYSEAWFGDLVQIFNEDAFLYGKTGTVLKMDYQGSTVWQRTFDTDRPLIISGNQDVLTAVAVEGDLPRTILKLDFENTLLDTWLIDEPLRIFSTITDSAYMYVFGSGSGGGIYIGRHGYVGKYDLSGNLVWQNSVGDCSRSFGTVDEDGNVYMSGTFYPDLLFPTTTVYYKTVKYDADGNRLWVKLWDGDLSANYNWSQWLQGVIPYPGGGCIVIGSLTQIDPDDRNRNYTDFGAIAYDDTGGVRWKLRFRAYPDWERNDLAAATWDRDGHLMFFGSAEADEDVPGGGGRYMFLSKWFVPGVTIVDTAVAVDPESGIPTEFTLSQNYPNPFNPRTMIAFELSEMTLTKLVVYNLLGQEVAILIDELRMPGRHEAVFNGQSLPSGTYLYRLTTSTFTETKKMVLLK